MTEDKKPRSTTERRDKEKSTVKPAHVNRRALIQGGLAGATLLSAPTFEAWAKDHCKDLLVFKEKDLRRAVAQLFELLRADEKTRQLFFRNPSQLIIATILPNGAPMPPKQEVSEANRFLFSLLSNDGFRQWVSEFQAQLAREIEAGELDPKTVDKGMLYEEVARAFVEYGDKNLVASLAMGPVNQGIPPENDDDLCSVTHVSTCIESFLIVAIAAIVVLVLTQIDLTPLTTPSSSLSPRELRSIADQLVVEARRLDREGTLRDPAATIQ